MGSITQEKEKGVTYKGQLLQLDTETIKAIERVLEQEKDNKKV